MVPPALCIAYFPRGKSTPHSRGWGYSRFNLSPGKQQRNNSRTVPDLFDKFASRWSVVHPDALNRFLFSHSTHSYFRSLLIYLQFTATTQSTRSFLFLFPSLRSLLLWFCGRIVCKLWCLLPVLSCVSARDCSSFKFSCRSIQSGVSRWRWAAPGSRSLKWWKWKAANFGYGCPGDARAFRWEEDHSP